MKESASHFIARIFDYVLILVPCLISSVLFTERLEAAQPTSRVIEAGWEFRAISSTDRADLNEWHPAQVPGVVQTDLLNNKLIPDPFYQDNEFQLQWIGLTDWEYRTQFPIDAATLGHGHVDLVFDGLDTFADVYLNDTAVLHTDNMFRRWSVPAKTLLRPGHNSLRVIFHSAVMRMLPYVKSLPFVLPAISTINGGNEEGIPTAPYTRKAPYQYGWDWGPRFVTEGIWRPVRLETWDAVRINNLHIHQIKISPDEARVDAELELQAATPGTAVITYTYRELSGGHDNVGKQTVQVAAGVNHFLFLIVMRNPKLWYPAGYGEQNRYLFSVAVRLGKDVAAEIEVKTGLRSVELRRVPDQWGKSFEFVVNGVSIFAKGANVIPFDSFPNRVTPEVHRRVIQAARDAHMNMLREWGGGYYESDDFYDICDELGMLVWQEFSFGGDMVPGDVAFQENVRQEAIQQIKRLRDHPSIAIWCGNNEVETGWHQWADRQNFKESVSPEVRERVWQDYVILFADIVKSAVHDFGDPVPYSPSSPSANFEEMPDLPDSGDMHYWAVWHALAPAQDYLKQFPRFMTEFGFQSFPEMRTIRSFAKPEDLDIRSKVMQAHQKNKGGNERILTYMLREYWEPKNFEAFVYLSQVQQAEIIKLGAEHLRRLRPRTMGSLYWQLNDCWPVASWASIDYYGNWKALHYYARRFYDDVLISPSLHDNQLDVYVVSDKQQALAGKIRVRLLDFSGNVLLDQMQEVQIPAASSASYLKFGQDQLAAKADLRRSFVVTDLEVSGQRVSRNLVFFNAMHNLELPSSPKIESTLNKLDGNYTLLLRAQVLARNVQVSFGDLDVQMSDNYVDLLPGETIELTARSASTLDELKAAMKITSLMDAFQTTIH
jgi:beta-mannosidase